MVDWISILGETEIHDILMDKTSVYIIKIVLMKKTFALFA